MKSFLSLLFMALSVQLLPAQRVPDGIQRSVAFVFEEKGTNYSPLGTGFFVHVPVQVTNAFMYFVTAKHVLKDTNDQYLRKVFIRVTLSNGALGYYPMSLTSTNWDKVYTHTDASVDLAVVPWTLPLTVLRQISIPRNLIATQLHYNKFGIREGDEMFFTGLFTPFYGKESNIPVFRFGRLSVITEEKVSWPEEPPQHLYLMQTDVFGGNSGSPTFFHFRKERNPGDASFLLGGIIKGYFRNRAEIVKSQARLSSLENAGIAMFIPSFYLQEVLDLPELKQSRGELESNGKNINAHLNQRKINQLKNLKNSFSESGAD